MSTGEAPVPRWRSPHIPAIRYAGMGETWEPIFTSHGFRYVEITGLKAKPDLDVVMGIVAHADMPRTGYFESSNERSTSCSTTLSGDRRGITSKSPPIAHSAMSAW